MEVGWKQIWALYGWKELFSKKNKPFYFSLIFAFIILVIIYSLDVLKIRINSTYEHIGVIIDLGISILPTLLGFNLGAYALIIGFLTNKLLVKALTKKKDGYPSDPLQRISSIFAINIITQAFTLLCIFLLKIFIGLKIPSLDIYFCNIELSVTINYLIFFSILFLTLYSVMLLIQNAINIFDFSQLFTHFAIKEENDKTE